jgi:hypothetical protein
MLILKCFSTILYINFPSWSSMAPRLVRFGVRSRKLSNVGQSWDGWSKIYFRASDGTLSRWSRLHLQWLAPTNQHGARAVSYGPFFLCVIHKEGLCPSSGDINRLMMIINLPWITLSIKKPHNPLGSFKDLRIPKDRQRKPTLFYTKLWW